MRSPVTFTWFGHSCVEVESAAGRILFDPWFGNPTSPKPVDAVEACDVLLVSHGHFDHLGGSAGSLEEANALAIARRTNPAWPCIHELSLWLEQRLGEGEVEVIGMNKGGTVDARGIGVTMVHADHSAGDWSAAADVPLALGEPVGFVVRAAGAPPFYFAGDTDVFGDMRLIADLHGPELGFLPIGGHYTMGPREAALAVELLGLRAVVPIHYGTFPVLTGTRDELRAALADRGLKQVDVISPERGERVEAAAG